MPAPISRSALWLTVCLATCGAWAQAQSWPNTQDIAHALKAAPFPSTEQIRTQPTLPLPLITPHAAAIDIETLVSENARRAIPRVDPRSIPGPLRIFITLDMPRASLQLLVDQASRAGAVLVLRGLKSNSMRTTLAQVSQLIGERQVAWVIDPEAFTHFGVGKAPTFVLTLDRHISSRGTLGCTTSCETTGKFVSVAGDVSLDFAVETMLRHRPEIAAHADSILKRLRASR